MGIIWLIIKIILWTLLVCVTFIISIGMLGLLAPIRYETYLEKYDVLNYEIKFRYLIGIKGYCYLQDGIQSSVISVFGKQVYSFKNEANTKKDGDEQQAKTISSKVNSWEEQIKEDAKNKVIDKKEKHLKKQKDTTEGTCLNDEHKEIKKTHPISSTLKEVSEENNFKSDRSQLKSIFNKMMGVPKYSSILISGFKLIKELITYLGPKEWSFELIIGREDPADTGELMAKLIMLYPLYYQHGLIQGNYETPGIWGGFLAQGKFCIAGILRRIIVFLWYKPVREFIKLIFNQRKGEKYGK